MEMLARSIKASARSHQPWLRLAQHSTDRASGLVQIVSANGTATRSPKLYCSNLDSRTSERNFFAEHPRHENNKPQRGMGPPPSR
jgi:hypothetical protein